METLEKTVTDNQDIKNKIKSLEEVQKEHEESIEKILSDPDAKSQAVGLANQVLNAMGKNWFTVLRFQRETNLKKEVAIQKLQYLKMFGLASMKWGNFSGEIIPQFKITLDSEARKMAIDNAIAWHKAEIDQLQLSKSKIK